MKNPALMLLLALGMLGFFASPAKAITADSLKTTICAAMNVNDEIATSDQKELNFVCTAYVRGVLDTLDGNTTFSDGEPYLESVTAGTTPEQVAQLFLSYMATHPEEGSSGADVVLLKVMSKTGLLSFTKRADLNSDKCVQPSSSKRKV